MRVKIAVFAPMPNAIVMITVTANPGDLRNCRIVYRTSCRSCSSQRTERSSRCICLARSTFAVGTSRSNACLIHAHASLPKVVLQQRQMRVDLAIQLCIQAAVAKQADALGKKTSEIPHG